MMTLKIAILAMMIGSSAVPMHNGDINKAMVCPQVPIVAVSNDTSALDTMRSTDTKTVPVRQVINKDKTYEQCMREAFERIYAEINRLLDGVVDRCDEQF